MRKLSLLICLSFLLGLPVVAQEELLPEGAYGTTIHGGVKAKELKTFSLEAQRGQVLRAQIFTKGVENGATLDIMNSAGDSMLGELPKLTKVDAVNLVLPKDDKYELQIKAGKATCSYVLEVTLEDADPKSP